MKISFEKLKRFDGDNRLAVGISANKTELGYTSKWKVLPGNDEAQLVLYKRTIYQLTIYFFLIKLVIYDETNEKE